MIKMSELTNEFFDQSEEIQENLLELLAKINVVRGAYNKPMAVSSGLRTMDHHIDIYKVKAAKKGIPFDISVVPMKSKHLKGQAVDIEDPNKELQQWILGNIALMEKLGFYFEDFDHTENWVHFQTLPPRSGKRFFIP